MVEVRSTWRSVLAREGRERVTLTHDVALGHVVRERPMYDLLGGGNVVPQRHRLERELGRGVGALVVVITERCPCRRELT